MLQAVCLPEPCLSFILSLVKIALRFGSKARKRTYMFDRDEFDRWIMQSDKTLISAEHDLLARDYNWSCFKAQQAAEYAVKALIRAFASPAFGHSVLKLVENLSDLGIEVKGLKHCAKVIDAHYIPARYPDAYVEGSPFEFYDEKTARDAIECARKIIDFVKAEAKRYG